MNVKKISLAIITSLFVSAYGIAATALPYHNPCDNLSSVTVLNESTTFGSGWTATTYQDNTVFRCKQSSTNVDRAIHASLWTPALDIKDGKIYKATVLVGSGNTPAESGVTLAMMSAPQANAQKTEILEVSPMLQFSERLTPQPLETIFVGDSSKPYFTIINSGGGAILYFVVGDILVEEYTGPVPPAKAENLSANVTGKEVTVSFQLPSKTLPGTPIEGSIPTVTLLRDDSPVMTWTNQQSGAQLSFTDKLSTGGEYIYTVVCSTGENQESRNNITVKVAGNSAPSVSKSYEKDENGDYIGANYFAPAVYIPTQGIKISWFKANVENPSYTIVRTGDNKVIAEKTSATEVIDTDINLSYPTSYQYVVYLDNSDGKTPLFTSSVVSLNNTLPFIPNVSQEAINDFTVVDMDKDLETWKTTSGVSTGTHAINKCFINSRCGDDWLITPGISLEAGKTYLVSVDALCVSMIEQNVELEILVGNSNDVNSFTQVLIPPTVLNHLTPRAYQAYYNASASGNTFFAFRALDPNGGHKYNDLGLSSIVISEVPVTTPEKVADLRMDYGTPGNGKLLFTAPSKNVSGGALTTISKIDVYNNGTLIKSFENVAAGTPCSVDVTFPIASPVDFRVESTNNGAKSLESVLDVMLVTAPYSNDFSDEKDSQGFKVIDPELLGYTWGYQSYLQAMRSYKPTGSTQNDYLIMPSIYLEAGNFYKLDFTTWLYTADPDGYYNNTIEVVLGKEPTMESLNKVVVAPYLVRGDSKSAVLLKDWFSVPETGVYYLAWHAKSDPNMSQEVYVDDINIGEKFPDTYPAGVDNFKITPDSEGAPNAVISFDLPKTDMAGRNLSSNFYGYAIYRDGFEISKGDGVIGKHIDFNDENIAPGVHLYTVRCFGAENKPTRDIEDIAYIGINRPGPVAFAEVAENPEKYGEITLSWGVPETDIDGFPLNTTNLTYTVGQYYLDPYTGAAQEIEFANGITGLSYTKQVKSANEAQEFIRFFVRANTIAGKGNPTVLTKWNAIGTPFPLPFVESFPNGNPSHIMMQERPFEGKYASWGYNNDNPVTGVKPVDGDKGLLMMETMEQGSGARLFSLRINLNADHPMMTFYVYNQSNEQRTDNNWLGISVREGNGEFKTVADMSVDQWAKGNPGWQKASVDLSEYAHKVVYIALEGIAVNMTFIHIDNIVIDQPIGTDIAVGGVSHDKVYIGVHHDINIPVHNMGSKDASDITVNFMLDGKILETRKIDKLESGKDVTLSFRNKLGRESIGRHVYSAEAIVADDEDANNNSSSGMAFYLQENNYPQVENLTAVSEGETMKLEWTEPMLPSSPVEITDDFERYPSWTTMETGGLGDYILVDADNCPVGGFQNFDLPNIPYGSKQSFTLWDFSNEFFAYDQTMSDRYKAHSGDKCLVSIFAPGVDDWTEDRLISPVLPGHAQTISFYAKSLDDSAKETFQVYYSFDGTQFKDYFDNRFPRESVGGTWTKFSYDLPEGTKYFIIEHYNGGYNGGYFFFLDDITYTPVGHETLELKGYNIYRDGTLLNESPETLKAYTDNFKLEDKVGYGVTAVYDRGESQASTVSVVGSGMDSINLNVKVYAENSEIVIKGAEGLSFSVVATSGMTVTNRIADFESRIPVRPGIYMVTINGETFKIAVR
ncbi:MAG: choice-of-anchor J domain-containing protein [Muribaculaceae bacterium]|nr:choice-of-anchor J domain-containing protein [Muribaculaceae bacterium]